MPLPRVQKVVIMRLLRCLAVLLDSMTEDEVRGVLGHEISHIQNGDMVTMSLLQERIEYLCVFLLLYHLQDCYSGIK